MSNDSLFRLTCAVGALVLFAGCMAPARAPRTTLDPGTGVSIVVADAPLVLARERRDIAAQARDYLTLVAAEIDEAGHRRLVWVAHQWSTIDSRNADVKPAAGVDLLLVADGRDLRFTPMPAGLAAPYRASAAFQPPDDAETVTTFYETDSDAMHYVATSRSLTASFPDSFALPFVMWKDGRPALQRLLEAVR